MVKPQNSDDPRHIPLPPYPRETSAEANVRALQQRYRFWSERVEEIASQKRTDNQR